MKQSTFRPRDLLNKEVAGICGVARLTDKARAAHTGEKKEVSLLLSIVIFLPLLGVIAIALLRGLGASAVKGIALIIGILTFIVSLGLYTGFDTETATFQSVTQQAWIPGLGTSYHIGIDGISLWLVLLTTFLTPVCILAAWNSIEKGLSGFMMSLLALETGMLGVFCALDLFLFFVFWESMLIPMYFLIGIWGGERRIYATVKFVLYTMAGSAFMLVGILALYFQNNNSFDLTTLSGPFEHSHLLFLAFFIAFAIKVPLFPFHTWLPDAHVEAPTAGSVILAGVLLKMGTYGIIRFCLPLFPDAASEFTPLIVPLAVIGIIYGALVAMVQPDLKKLVAYSSVSHLGFVVLGLFSKNPAGIQGSVLQMINHGLSTGALFLLVGMIYERRHSRMIVDFGGLAKQNADLCYHFYGGDVIVNRVTGFEWIRRRVYDTARQLCSGSLLEDICSYCNGGCDSRSRVYAVDVPTGNVWDTR